jgi:hypothetical protein
VGVRGFDMKLIFKLRAERNILPHWLWLALLACILSPKVSAQTGTVQDFQDPARQVHWAMGAFFGTGWYQVDDNRSMYIFRIPPSRTIRDSSLDENGKRSLGIRLQFPLTFGLTDLEDLPDFANFDNYATVSFTPGIELEIPVTENWQLKPYVNIGWGTETNSSDSAWIYYGGIRSRYHLGNKNSRWALLNAVYFAGYRPEFKSRGEFGSLMSGLEFSQPLKSISQSRGEDLFLNWHVTHNYFFDRLNFHIDDGRVESIKDQWELGLALGRGSKGFKIWFVTFEQLGLSYQWSSNKRFQAITFNLKSPFSG